MSIDASYDFDQFGLEVDYSLVEQGIMVFDKFISVVLDGTFHQVNQHDTMMNMTYNKMPYYLEDGREMQVLVSEYSLNSILSSAVQLDLYNYTYIVDSDKIEMLVPDFSRFFGRQDENKIIIKPTPIGF